LNFFVSNTYYEWIDLIELMISLIRLLLLLLPLLLLLLLCECARFEFHGSLCLGAYEWTDSKQNTTNKNKSRESGNWRESLRAQKRWEFLMNFGLCLLFSFEVVRVCLVEILKFKIKKVKKIRCFITSLTPRFWSLKSWIFSIFQDALLFLRKLFLCHLTHVHYILLFKNELNLLFDGLWRRTEQSLEEWYLRVYFIPTYFYSREERRKRGSFLNTFSNWGDCNFNPSSPLCN
jgi:hypothetical protein